MKGIRSKDNCYLWIPQEENFSSTCLMSKEVEVNLLHQKLDHLLLKGMKKVLSKEGVTCIPKLKIEKGKVCGKQTKISHPKLHH